MFVTNRLTIQNSFPPGQFAHVGAFLRDRSLHVSFQGRPRAQNLREERMRFFLGCILAIALSVLPASTTAGTGANNGSSDAKSTTASETKTSPETPARADASAEPAKSNLDLEIEELRDQLQAQSELIKQQQNRVQALEEQLKASSSGREALSSALAATPGSAVSSSAPAAAVNVVPASATIAALSPAPTPATPQASNAVPESPPHPLIHPAYIPPVRFVDFTAVWPSHDGGGGIGPHFARLPSDPAFQ